MCFKAGQKWDPVRFIEQGQLLHYAIVLYLFLFQVGLWESVQTGAVSGSLKGRGNVLYVSYLLKPRPYLIIGLGEAKELDNTKNNEIVIWDS